jgi:hypothetical protein
MPQICTDESRFGIEDWNSKCPVGATYRLQKSCLENNAIHNVVLHGYPQHGVACKGLSDPGILKNV